jgi:chaperonin GroES
MKMTVKPLFDKVVVEAVEKEEKTKSGFFLPSASQEKQQMAKIVAVGPGGIIDGKEVVMQVKEGDTVLYAKYSGSEFKVDGRDLVIIRQSDILAIVED